MYVGNIGMLLHNTFRSSKLLCVVVEVSNFDFDLEIETRDGDPHTICDGCVIRCGTLPV